MRCPVCNTVLSPGNNTAYLPFCSKRCQLIDLGDWLNENHRIPSDTNESEWEDLDNEGDLAH